jgi:hydroxymethylpyrimidine pyrophosphatase-like HAD family hydrolase
MVIGIDFDGTLVQGKTALPGAREAINILREQGHKILIFSCNRTEWIKKVLNDNDIRYDYIWDGDKPVCDLYIDDRNIEFKGDWKETVEQALQGRSQWSKEAH